MSSRINITDLDFDTIKNNLKNFLRQQDEFSDYDFDGSGLSILLDILAYNTHYNAYYLNMVANEAFLESAIIRDSVVSHAKTLGYTPSSAKSALAKVNITVESGSTTLDTLTIPRGTIFRSGLIDGKSYSFVNIKDYTVTKSNTQYIFENVDLYQGKYVNYNFNYDETTNPKSIFTIPDQNIDTQTIVVSVKKTPANTDYSVYNLATDELELTKDSEVYFLQAFRNSQYQFYFGDGNISKKLDDGSLISLTYVLTDGSEANGARTFTGMQTIGGFSSYTVTAVDVAAGGADEESIDSIKLAAPLQYATQNRLVTLKDYESYIKKAYPSIDSVSIWGGEDNVPKIYGKVFLSLKPKQNYYLTTTEKQRIIDEIISPKSMINVLSEIIDPEYIYVVLTGKIYYNKNKTFYTPNEISNLARAAITNYKTVNLDKFDSIFVLSKLEENIDNVDKSIIGSEFVVKLQKRIVPELNKSRLYTLNYDTTLHRGTILDGIRSTEFYVKDLKDITRKVFIQEVPLSFTGVESINITDPGQGYLEAPTVTITGDGEGATAIAEIVNGRLSRINIINRGINYSRAIVTITSSTGYGAKAVAVLGARIGNLEMIYYDSLARKQIVNDNIGVIDYDSGSITLNNLNVYGLDEGITDIRFTVESQEEIIKTKRNQILTLDVDDASSIRIEVAEI